jgi:NADH-quinone oxidoreductase subunit H
MRLGWKFLVPISLVWIVAVIAVRDIKARYGFSAPMVLVILGVIVVVAVVIAFITPERKVSDNRVEVTGGGYPVPPLNLEIPNKPRRRTTARERRSAGQKPADTAVTAGAGKESGDGSV